MGKALGRRILEKSTLLIKIVIVCLIFLVDIFIVMCGSCNSKKYV